MSLKADLIKQISAKPMTYNALVEYCRIWGAKVSNAERRLRECEEIEAVRNKKGYIVAYRKLGPQGQLF